MQEIYKEILSFQKPKLYGILKNKNPNPSLNTKEKIPISSGTRRIQFQKKTGKLKFAQQMTIFMIFAWASA